MLACRTYLLYFFCITILLGLSSRLTAEPVVLDLWPDGVPASGQKDDPSEEVRTKTNGILRITNVSSPQMTVYRPDDPNGAAVLVCPGGGYKILAYEHEGTDVCEFLTAHGVTAILLKYRVPSSREVALQDAQRALGMIHHHAEEWGIDPDRIGVIGFSAGGHLAASASTQFTARRYEAIDSVDTLSCRPDFVMLVYPAYLDDKQGNVSTDLNLQVDIPPSLILHSEDDRNHVTGSRLYAKRLKEKGGQHAFKLYSSGGHGYGLHSKGEARVWPDEAIEWLRAIGTQ